MRREVELRPARRAGLRWRVELVDGETVRRTLLVALTGEVLDDVWLDEDGRVRSWSKPPARELAELAVVVTELDLDARRREWRRVDELREAA